SVPSPLPEGLKLNKGERYKNTPIMSVNTAPTNIHNKPDTLLVLRFSVAPFGFLANMDLVLPTEYICRCRYRIVFIESALSIRLELKNYHQIMATAVFLYTTC